MAVLAVSVFVVPAASAADQLEFVSPDRAFTFVGGAGYTFLRGDEIVYEGENRISHLIWESHAPVINGRFNAELHGAWTLSGSATLGTGGNSYMEDYDWLEPYQRGYAFDDWTHRSQHPDTDLHRYMQFDLALGRIITLGDDATVNLHGGFKYTNVKWTAYGGSFTYSETGYRADIGDFTPGERGISFEQRYPALFLGAEGAKTIGAWTFSGSLRGGVSVGATDTDHHWMRDLRFEETYGAIPFASVSAGIAYAVSGRMNLFLTGSIDRYFHAKGNTTLFDIPTGGQGPTFTDGAGMKLSSETVTAGFKLAF